MMNRPPRFLNVFDHGGRGTLYEKGIVTLGQAKRIAGLSKWGILELLAREGIPIHYGEEELREDLQIIRRFMKI